MRQYLDTDNKYIFYEYRKLSTVIVVIHILHTQPLVSCHTAYTEVKLVAGTPKVTNVKK